MSTARERIEVVAQMPSLTCIPMTALCLVGVFEGEVCAVTPFAGGDRLHFVYLLPAAEQE